MCCCLYTKVAGCCPWLTGIGMLSHHGSRTAFDKGPWSCDGFFFFKRWQFQDSCFLGRSSSWCVTSILWSEATQNLLKSIPNTTEIFFHRKNLSGPRVSSPLHTPRCCDGCWVFQSSSLGLISWNWSAWLLWLYFILLQGGEMAMNRLRFARAFLTSKELSSSPWSLLVLLRAYSSSGSLIWTLIKQITKMPVSQHS